MYKLPKEIKLVINISLLVATIIMIILVFIKPIYILNFGLGYAASLVSLLKNNYFITSAIYRVYPNPKRTMVTSNIFSLVLYLFVLGFSFYLGLVNGIICVVAIFIVKIIIFICYGFSRKEGDQN